MLTTHIDWQSHLDADTVGMIALTTLGAGDHLSLLTLAVTAAACTDILVDHEAVFCTTDDRRVRRVVVVVFRHAITGRTLRKWLKV